MTYVNRYDPMRTFLFLFFGGGGSTTDFQDVADAEVRELTGG